MILSAGSINSPKILELSGVGQGPLLKSHGIEVLSDIKGVGENLTDHLQTRLTYETNLKVTVNDILNNKFRGALEALRYIFRRDGLMSIASATVHALMRSKNSKIYPDLKVQIMLISGNNRYSRKKNHGMDSFSGFSLGVFPLYPSSRGTTHLRSNNFRDNPIIKESTWNSNQPAGVTGDALRDFRLKKIANSISQGLPSDDIWDWGNGTFNSAVKLFDNRLIAWETASDGFESNSPNLYSEANFLLTNDDALKIGSRNQQYVSNTLHQGPAGSAIMAGNYGFTNGPVFDSTVDGLFVHRIINDVAQQDPLGGLIGFRTHFNENLVGQQGNGSGIFANNFNNIYVPQMGYDNQFNIQAKANVVTRLGMVPAMSQSTFTSIGARDFGDGLKGLSNQVYGTGQFNIRNLQVDALMEDQQQPFPFSVVVDDTQSSIGDTDPIYNATGGGKNFYSFARAGKTSTTNLWFSKAPADTSNGVTQFVDVYGINETNDINNGDMASMQTTINDPILDLRNIFNKVNLSINIETNCGFQNQLFLVKATVDTITGQRYLDNPNGGRIAFENTDYCRSLIRDNLISITTPERRFGGEGKNFNLTLAVNRDEASLYVPVLINPHGSLFTYGKETSYGHQNLRNNTSKLNTFYFEDIKGLGDSDFNDLICTFSVLD